MEAGRTCRFWRKESIAERENQKTAKGKDQVLRPSVGGCCSDGRLEVKVDEWRSGRDERLKRRGRLDARPAGLVLLLDRATAAAAGAGGGLLDVIVVLRVERDGADRVIPGENRLDVLRRVRSRTDNLAVLALAESEATGNECSLDPGRGDRAERIKDRGQSQS